MFNGDKLYMFPSAGSIQVMGFAMAGDGCVIGIDSASRDEAQKIEETLLGLGGKVDCWFFTHSHYDHIEGFVEIMRRGKVRVDSVCYAFPSLDYFKSVEPDDRIERGVENYLAFEEQIKARGVKVIKPQKGVYIEVGHFKVMPLSDGSAAGSRLNASSVVYRAETRGDSVLFLGDMDWSAQDKILREFPDKLKCPVVQMAHHGQDGVTEEFYRAVQPKVALWCAPEWLWNNDCGNGFNTGPWKTVETRGWMEKLKTVNYRFEKEITVLK